MAARFADIIKDSPGVGDVHVGTALGNQKPRRRRGFKALLGEVITSQVDKIAAIGAGDYGVPGGGRNGRPASAYGNLRGGMDVSDLGGPSPKPGDVISVNGAQHHVTGGKGFSVQVQGGATHHLDKGQVTRVDKAPNGHRHWVFGKAQHSDFAKAGLRPMDGDASVAHSPFPYDPQALERLREDQVPRFFGALTDSERLPTQRVNLADLTAMQNRVDPVKVNAMRGGAVTKPALVIQAAGRQYIADGHHRLSADLLDGKQSAEVRFLDLTPISNALKRAAPAGDGWETPITIAKMDADRQMVFGWASVVEKNGRLVVDSQDDMILPDDLETAAYDYVLYSRQQGDMHLRKQDMGRLIESCVFTHEKQQAMGIVLPDRAVAWWVGFKVDHPELWQAHKRGERPEFSIGGGGRRVPA